MRRVVGVGDWSRRLRILTLATISTLPLTFLKPTKQKTQFCLPMPVGLTLYDVLGITTDASTDDGSSLFSSVPPFLRNLFSAVRKAYKTKALETHPDKLEPTASDRERRAAEGKFRNVGISPSYAFTLSALELILNVYRSARLSKF